MQRTTEILLVVCLMMAMTSFLQQTTAAPSWRPQGRFGKRGDAATSFAGNKRPYYWRPQGRYGKRSDDTDDLTEGFDSGKPTALSGEIWVPVEAMATAERAESLRVVAKLCTLTGVAGFSPCSWTNENASETY